MNRKMLRGFATTLCLASGLSVLAACADERPYPAYNYGMAYTPPPCDGCAQGNWHDYHDGQWHVQ
jgi:hypothetical protein